MEVAFSNRYGNLLSGKKILLYILCCYTSANIKIFERNILILYSYIWNNKQEVEENNNIYMEFWKGESSETEESVLKQSKYIKEFVIGS